MSSEKQSVRDVFPVNMQLENVVAQITKERLDAFGFCSTDQNPLHFVESFAQNTIFGRCIAHGMLPASLISAVFGGIDGAVYLKQSLEFKKPVYIGDTIIATAQVTGYGKKPGTVEFFTECYNENNEVVIEGMALIWFPDLTS